MTDTSEPTRVSPRTKPHYWIMVRGAEVWNRWAREGVSDEQWETHLEWLKQAPHVSESERQERIDTWQNFGGLTPLSKEEKHEILEAIP